MNWLVRMARWFGYSRALCLCLLAALVFLRVSDPAVLQELRVRVFDLYQVIQPRLRTIKPVVIVDIDEKSLKALGQWPWPRTRVADLVSQLTRMGAAVIAFDIIFAEPDRMSPALAAQSFRDIDDETRKKLQALPSNDLIMADAIRHSRVVLGDSALPTPQAEPQKLAVGVATLGGDARPYLFTFPGLLRNLPVLQAAAAGRGLVTIKNEADGIVRRVPMVMVAQGTLVPSLTFEMLRVATRTSTILLRMDAAGVKSVAVPGFDLPTDRNGQVWVHFAKHDPALYVSAIDVLEGRVPADRFDHKLVLVGTSATGLFDVKTTPLDAVLPGVEVHAQVLESALSHSILSAPNYAIAIELAAAVLVSLFIIMVGPSIGALTMLVLGAVVAAMLVGGSWYFFTEQKLLIDATFPLLATALIYLTLTFSNYLREQLERRRIRSAFGQYLSPALVEKLAQSHEGLTLGGEDREMTVMFSDVRGFTTISETYKDDPQGLTTLMNNFLTPMTNAIIERNGTIDKYIGDAIMAFWNAPLRDGAHEINACHATLDMLDRVAAINVQREQEARAGGARFIPLKIGIGLNTGRCVVGNMGSQLRFNYSVLGDSVNLASRLEGQSKTYGVPIIIGERTASAALDHFAILEIDRVTVKGKTEPETIYTIVGRDDVRRDSRFQEVRGVFDDMLSLYRSQKFDAAHKAVIQARAAAVGMGLDGLLDIYSIRIGSFQKDAPPHDWSGVFVLDSK
ncbi:MAG: CHASE2 domain-containing protein [Rhodopseudomonas sp.]|nr:CHASE2 domain-containing protein [Rhodopseudomonas sp.]